MHTHWQNVLLNYAANATSTAPAPLCATKEQLDALNCQNIINPTGTVNAQVREYQYSMIQLSNVLGKKKTISCTVTNLISSRLVIHDEHRVEVNIKCIVIP